MSSGWWSPGGRWHVSIDEIGEPPREVRARRAIPWSARTIWQLLAPPGFLLFPLVVMLALVDAPSSIALYLWGEPTVAMVAEDDGPEAEYTFVTADGTEVRGRTHSRRVRATPLAGTVAVTYLPAMPSVHCLGAASIHPFVVMITPIALGIVTALFLSTRRRLRAAHAARLTPDLVLARDGVVAEGRVVAIEPLAPSGGGYRERPRHRAGRATVEVDGTRINLPFAEGMLAVGDSITLIHPPGAPSKARPLRHFSEVLFAPGGRSRPDGDLG